MKVLFISVLLMLPIAVFATPHKCVINGKTTYTEKQCPTPESEKKIDKGGFGVLDTSGQRQQWAEKEGKANNDKSDQAQKEQEALIKGLIAKAQDFPSTSLPLDEYNKKMNERNAAQKLLDTLLGAKKSASTPKVSIETQKTSINIPQASTYTQKSEKCSDDFSCGIGSKCVKAPLESSGVCMKSVNEHGISQYNLPDIESVRPNMSIKGQCTFNTDCPIGFQCDSKLKVCVR